MYNRVIATLIDNQLTRLLFTPSAVVPSYGDSLEMLQVGSPVLIKVRKGDHSVVSVKPLPPDRVPDAETVRIFLHKFITIFTS